MSWFFPDLGKIRKKKPKNKWAEKVSKNTRKLTIEAEAKRPLAFNAKLYQDERVGFLTRTPPDIRSRDRDARRLKLTEMTRSLGRESGKYQTKKRGSPLRLEQLPLQRLAVSPATGNFPTELIPPPATPDLNKRERDERETQTTPFAAVSMWEGSQSTDGRDHSRGGLSTAKTDMSAISRTTAHSETTTGSSHGRASSSGNLFKLGSDKLGKVQMALDGNTIQLVSKQIEALVPGASLDSNGTKTLALKDRPPDVSETGQTYFRDPLSIILQRQDKLKNMDVTEPTVLFDPFTMHERYFAATIIQKIVRGMLVRLWIVEYRRRTNEENLRQYNEERRVASTLIQKMVRGRQARIRFTRFLVAKIISDPYLIDFFPVLRPGSKASERSKEGKALQLTIDELRELYNRLTYLGECAIQIQRIFRGTMGRVQAMGRAMDNARILLEYDAAMFLQSYIRMWLVKDVTRKQMQWYRHNENGFLRIRDFVNLRTTEIQTFYRKFTKVFWYKNARKWVMLLQKRVRGVFGRMRVAKMQASALIIQCAVRIYFAKIVFSEVEEKISVRNGISRVLQSMETSISERFYASRKIQSHVRRHQQKRPFFNRKTEYSEELGFYEHVMETELPDRKKSMNTSKFQAASAALQEDEDSEDPFASDDSEEEEEVKQGAEKEEVLSPLQQRQKSIRELLKMQLVFLDSEWTEFVHKKQNLLLGRMPAFIYSKALQQYVNNPRDVSDAEDLLAEGKRFDADGSGLRQFFSVCFYSWKNDKGDRYKAFHLALLYRFYLDIPDRASRFFDLAGESDEPFPRNHVIMVHTQLFNETFAKDLESGELFREVLLVAPRKIDGLKMEVRVLRFGDNLMFSAQMWKLVKAKREELAAVGKNNLQYAIRGVKEYRKILLEEDVVGFLRHLDRPRLIRPRYGEQLAKAFLPMLKITQVKGKGQKLDIKFKQEPFPKMSMLTKSKKVYLTIVISQDDAGGLRVSAVSEDDEVYKCWFMYREIRELFLDYPVLWYHRKLPGWRDKGDKLLQMLVANLDLIDRTKRVKRVVKDKYELSKFERELYESGTLTDEVKYLSLEFLNPEKRKRNAKRNFAATVIQQVWRGKLGRKLASDYKLYVMATRIRSFWRNQRARYFLVVVFMQYSRRYWSAVRIQKLVRGALAKIQQGKACGALLKLRPDPSAYLSFQQSVNVMLNQKKKALTPSSTLSGTVSYAMYQLIFAGRAEECLGALKDAHSNEAFREQPLLLYLMATVTQFLHPTKPEESREIAYQAYMIDPEGSSFQFYFQTYFSRYRDIHPRCPYGKLVYALCLFMVFEQNERALELTKEAAATYESRYPWVEVNVPVDTSEEECDWSKELDEASGSEYYLNNVTGETSWTAPQTSYWWNTKTDITTQVGEPKPANKMLWNATEQSKVIAGVVKKNNSAATTIQTFWRGSVGRREGAAYFLQMLAKQKIAVDKVMRYKAQQDEILQRELALKKLQKKWTKYNEKLKKKREAPVSFFRFKRIMSCAKAGIEYYSDDYDSSDEEDSQETASVASEQKVVVDNEAAEQYMFYQHFFNHDYARSKADYAGFRALLPENKKLRVGALLLPLFSAESEDACLVALKEFSSLDTSIFEQETLQVIDRNVLQLALRQHRHKKDIVLEGMSLFSCALWHQLLLKEYFKAHEFYKRALAILPNHTAITSNYAIFIDQGHGKCMSPILRERKEKMQRMRDKIIWRRNKLQAQKREESLLICRSIVKHLVKRVQKQVKKRAKVRKQMERISGGD